MALSWALKCQAITEEYLSEMEDFDLAFAQEALARAFALAGNLERAQDHFETAGKLGYAIKDKEDQKIFQADLNSGNWYGIT